ncbi:hypothetical protein CUR178_08242 [Leishmania enriettii]|uniref:Leucine-rich repeat protein n=1 Tax=Leishmania enriettii TaxID=5663 RepID=A0A836KQX6_LEIEN|nr:hypothetical protein CUR178_08242 [Leishmania enriettii]
MSSGVTEGAVPKAQKEGVAASLSPSSVPAGLYRDPCAAALGGRGSGKASTHTRKSKASRELHSGLVKRKGKTAALALREPPASLSAAAESLGDSAAAEKAAACPTDASSTDPSARNGAERTAVVRTQVNATCHVSPPSGNSPTESPAVPAANGAVLCVELTEAHLSETPNVAFAVNDGRLDLRMRGLVALPCLHVPATSSSAHGSGDATAGRLYAVSFRHNAISSLLTQRTRPLSIPRASPLTPRSSPLQCYAHVSSLDLTHNALTSIAGIDALRCLRSLRLAFNRLTSLAPLWASPHVAELNVLDVSSNALTELLSAEDARTLEEHQIRVVSHPKHAHSTAKSSAYKSMCLRVLYASNNEFREVPSAIYTFTQLTDLRLRNNAIQKVPDGFPARVCLPQLRRIDVSMNKLPAAIVDAVVARAEEMAESPRRRRTASPAVSPCATADYLRASAPRSHLGSGPSACAKTAAFSPSALRASRTGDGAPVGETRGGAVECTGGSSEGPLPAPHGGKKRGKAAADERDGASAVNDSGRRHSPVSAANATGDTESQKGRGALPKAKANTAALLQSPARARHESASAAASSSCKRKATASLSPAAPATAAVSAPETQQRDAVQRVSENVYSIDLSVWAASVHRRLEKVMRRSPTSATSGAPSATSTCCMQELLVSLYSILGENSSGASPTALPRYRRRLATTARTLATLLQCLPSCSIAYSEEAQRRCAPLLLLTGITAAVVGEPCELLLYEVLALHILKNCLCTAKTATGGASPPSTTFTAASPTPQSTDAPSSQARRGENFSEPTLRTKAPAADRTSSQGVGTSRQLNFHVPLHVIHVIACTDGGATSHSTTSTLWAYLTWRQRWEAAVSRRRLFSKSVYICELGKQSAGVHVPPPLFSKVDSLTGAANGNSTRTAQHLAEARPLYPFAANSPVSRVLEWRRLHEHRPASYYAVPPPWELLYDLLLRPSLSKSTAPQWLRAPAMPPLLTGVGSRLHHVRGMPVDLACVLLCSEDYPRCTEAPKMYAARASQVPPRPPPSTAGSAANSARNGTFSTATPSVPCGDVIERALELLHNSLQLWSRVEREASTVATEQVTACNMPLYSAEEVLQSRKAAIAALSSLGPRNASLRCELCVQSDVAEGAVKNTASCREVACDPQHRVPQSRKGKAAAATETATWGRERETRCAPSVAADADDRSASAAAADAADSEAGGRGSIGKQDTSGRFDHVHNDNVVLAAEAAAQSPAFPLMIARSVCES